MLTFHAGQTIHIKCRSLFSVKNKSVKMSSAVFVISTLRVTMYKCSTATEILCCSFFFFILFIIELSSHED